jgi:hypothetical protein
MGPVEPHVAMALAVLHSYPLKTTSLQGSWASYLTQAFSPPALGSALYTGPALHFYKILNRKPPKSKNLTPIPSTLDPFIDPAKPFL